MTRHTIGVNKKNANQKGKGIISDVYKAGTEFLFGKTPSSGNPYAVPQLNEKFGLKDPRLFKMPNYAGPGTLLQKQLKHKKAVNMVDKISMLHDVNYSLAKNKKDIRDADNIMVNQLSNSISSDFSFAHPLRTIENIVAHPIRTTADIINKGAAIGAITLKEIGEDLGLKQYGLSKPPSEKFRKTLEQKKLQLIQQFAKKK